jgi:long-chain acyl-CoA synthetase
MNLAFLPHQIARCEPDRIAVVEAQGRQLSYGQFEAMSGALAHRLAGVGLGRGEVCALTIRDDALHMAAIFAVWRLGAILLPLDWRMTPAELAAITGRFRPRLLISAGTPHRARGKVEAFNLDERDFTSGPRGPVVPVDEEPALYGLSSGSTGEPKAAVITHRQHVARVMSYAFSYPLLRDDRYLSTMPVAYNWGRNMAVSHLCLGATLILAPALASPTELVDFASRLKATTMAAVPSVAHGLLALPFDGAPLLAGLRHYVSSGAPLHSEARKAFRERVCANLAEAYGSTETGGISVLAPADQQHAPGSVGRPAVGVDLQVVDGAGNELPPGQIGRIRCRGPGVIERYLGDDRHNAERLAGGWYYTGDDGYFDDTGFLYLDGRDASVIKRGGYTINAAEIERVLVAHPSVADAAVAGFAAGAIGEDIVAFVVPKGRIQPHDLAIHCRIALSAMKQPQAVRFVDAIPRNRAGKVDIAALRSLLAKPNEDERRSARSDRTG